MYNLRTIFLFMLCATQISAMKLITKSEKKQVVTLLPKKKEYKKRLCPKELFSIESKGKPQKLQCEVERLRREALVLQNCRICLFLFCTHLSCTLCILVVINSILCI